VAVDIQVRVGHLGCTGNTLISTIHAMGCFTLEQCLFGTDVCSLSAGLPYPLTASSPVQHHNSSINLFSGSFLAAQIATVTRTVYGNVRLCGDKRSYINPSILYLELGLQRLQLMNTLLKKNICELPPYAMNSDIDDLDARRKKYIGEGLEYRCRSWAKHLRLASRNDDNARDIIRSLKEFFDAHLLQWLEVLSIVGDLRCAVYSSHDLTAWLVDVSTVCLFFSSCQCSLSVDMQAKASDEDLLAIVKDSERFVLRFFDAIELSAPHIYESALPLSPSSSLVRALYLDQVSMNAKFSGIDDAWDACIRTIRPQDMVFCVALSYKDDLIAVGEADVVEIFEAATGQRRATLMMTSSGRTWTLAFSPDDNIIAVNRFGCEVYVWDLRTGYLMGALKEHTSVTKSIAFSPCGDMIATCSADHTIQIWNTFSLDCRSILEGHSNHFNTICWSAIGNQVISGSSDTTVKAWSVSDKLSSQTFTIFTGGEVLSVVSSPDSTLVAAGSSDGMLKVFDMETSNVLHTLSTKVDSIRSLNQGRIMYTISDMFVVHDLTESANVLTFEHGGLDGAMSSDGTRPVSCQHDLVKIWQTETPIVNPDTARHHTKPVTCVTFSSDGRLVASGSDDCTDKIWDTSTGQCLTTFRGHHRGVVRVTFTLTNVRNRVTNDTL
jgi:WD40 repeat protein